MSPDFVILCGLSTLQRCLLTTVAQDKSPRECMKVVSDILGDIEIFIDMKVQVT